MSDASPPRERKTDFLGRDAIFPLLLKMGLPAAVGMLVNALYNVVDTIFVGQGVGPLAIAALSIVFPLQTLVSAIAQAMGTGAASIVSRRLGEKRPEEAASAMGATLASVLVVNLVLVALAFAFMEPLLAFFGASPVIMPYALEYTGIVAAGFFFFSLSLCASNLVRAEGNAKAAMAGMVLGAILNTGLDPLFIFGFGWGVRGAALATVLSQAASCLYLLSHYLRGRSHVPLRPRHLRCRPAVLREVAALGAPTFVQSAGMSILVLVANHSLLRYGGDEAVTIYGMITKFNMIIILPIIGIVQGFQPIAGYNFGARRFDRVRESITTAIATAFALSLVGYAVIQLAPRLAMSLFTPDPGLIAKSARDFRIFGLFIPLAAVQIAGSTYVQAVGKPLQAFFLGISRQFIVLIPLLLVLPRFLGLDGIWIAYPAADLLSSSITVGVLARELRRLGRAAAGGAA